MGHEGWLRGGPPDWTSHGGLTWLFSTATIMFQPPNPDPSIRLPFYEALALIWRWHEGWRSVATGFAEGLGGRLLHGWAAVITGGFHHVRKVWELTVGRLGETVPWSYSLSFKRGIILSELNRAYEPYLTHMRPCEGFEHLILNVWRIEQIFSSLKLSYFYLWPLMLTKYP